MYFSIIEEYITNWSDTIYKIAVKFYFKWHLWMIIYDYNKESLGDDPYNIPASGSVKIIGLNTESIKHIISEGDTYHNLSMSYFGTERHFFDIGRANGYKHLIAGESITIPALITAKDLYNARRIRNVCS